jgi:hypothetical protein
MWYAFGRFACAIQASRPINAVAYDMEKSETSLEKFCPRFGFLAPLSIPNIFYQIRGSICGETDLSIVRLRGHVAEAIDKQSKRSTKCL